MKADGQSRPAAIAWIRLGEVTEMLSGGTPSKARSDYWSGDIPWVSAKDMKQRRLVDAEDHITTSGLANGSKLAPANATLILVRGMTLLDDIPICSLSREVAFNQDVKAIVPKRVIEPRYLTYALLAAKPQLLSMVQEAGHGTGTLPTDRLKNLEIPLPTKSEQCAVTEILGGLDDKIELNRRMNETLEAMARAIFKSWFVDFEPVRAKMEGRWRRGQSLPGLPADLYDLFPDSFEDSPLGKVPKGWRVVPFGKVVEIFDSKRVPLSSRERANRRGPFPYFGAAGILDHIDDYLFDGTFVLLGEDGSVVKPDGRPFVQYVWGKFWVNNHAHVLAGTGGVSSEHLALFLKDVNIAPYVTGAVQPKLNQANMCSILFLLPSDVVCRLFAYVVRPLYDAVKVNVEQSELLAALRDALLPKLISGEIRIGDATAVVSEAV